ncbi:MAG: hypothetical protein BroJett011_43120 [Chloroflexota bacterium]|nr:MAG: hypothetical protein BroJett011_43120 [Chloroflexota bacterium]
MNQLDYFDVLPYHPCPTPFESLASYLTRLAQGNGLKSIQGLTNLCFPDHRVGTVTLPAADYPPASWGALPHVTACPEPVLLGTTFYYLAEKFGRSSRPQAMGRFLQSSLSSTLRYCPACLGEAAGYVLPWRFLTLTGCARHGCQLLERCGHCGQPLPLLTTPFALGRCPVCHGQLRDCQAAPLPDQDWPMMLEHDQDLRFLLAAHPLPALRAEEAIKSVGLRLAYWRLERGLVAIDLARQVEFPQWAVYGLEGRMFGGATFERYVQYAAQLGVTLRQVFQTTLPPEIDAKNWRAWCRTTLSREQGLLEQVQAAIAALKAADQPVSQSAICQRIGLKPECLRRYPRVKAILAQVVADRKQVQQQQALKREQLLLRQVQTAISRLQTEGQPVSQRTVSQLVGVTKGTLRNYPQVKALVAAAATDFYLARQRQLQARLNTPPAVPSMPPPTAFQREAELVEIVQAAINCLKAEGGPVTQKMIGQRVGLHPSSLQRYPRIRLILEQVTLERHLALQSQLQQTPLPRPHHPHQVNLQRQAELVEAVQAAIDYLQAEGQPVTQRAIGRIVGSIPSSLSHYPHIRAIFSHLAQQQLQLKQAQKQQREQTLLVQVQAAIVNLEALNQPLTQANLAQLLEVSPSTLRYYPSLKAVLRQMLDRRRHTMMVQAQLRDTVLAEKTLQAADTLTRLGQPVTKHAIGRLVGLDPGGYKRYPQAYQTLDQVTRKE